MISGTSLIPVSDFPYSECNLGHVLARLFASKEAAVRHFPKSCLGAALVVATFNLVDTPSAAALTMKECSAKYRAAKAGIVTGILLAVARISGETAPLLFTALNNQFWSTNMNAPVASLPVVIFQFALSPYKDWQALAWTGALIITFAVLALSVSARALSSTRKQS